jgi:CheY-like chemotaxis protein
MTRIAVIDDDVNVLRLMTHLFEDRGWEVLPCDNPAHALDFMRLDPPDLIILDVVMSAVYSGWKILQLLKQDPITRDIPVLVCTGAPDLGDKQSWLNSHGIGTLQKPFSVDELFTVVDAALVSERQTPA